MMRKWHLFFLLCILGLICFSCHKSYSPEEKLLINSILASRMEKDSLFRHAHWSPFADQEKKHFSGLKYFPVDLSFRFEGPINRYDSLIPDTIMGTKGDLRPAVRYGYFTFKYRGEGHQLVLFKILRDDPDFEKYLFLGFTDETTGDKTYDTGRYIDVLENSDNHYIIDFNMAYNPYCAYNPRYSCAIPSEENHLPFAIRAGEKIYQEHK